MPKPKPHGIAVVGDLHAGSTVGLFPPSFRTDGGQIIVQSEAQKWLWACWLEYCNWLNSFELDALIINGDLPNGINARDAQNLSANEADQYKFVLAVLDPLIHKGAGKAALVKRTPHIYISRGTGYHSGGAGSREEIIGERIGAWQDACGNYSRYQNWMRWRGKVIHATHHISVAAVYPLTPMQRAMREMRERAQVGVHPMPDVDVRSHVHTSHIIESPDNKWIVTCPAWQMHTEFAHKVAPAGQPSIGGIVIWINDETQRVEVSRLLFRLPQAELAEIPTS